MSHPQSSADICDAAVDRAMTSFQQAVNSMVSCKRCNGTGYHHGFGEHGHDPDWCEVCGGCQSVPEFDDREAMRQAIKAAQSGAPAQPTPVIRSCPETTDILELLAVEIEEAREGYLNALHLDHFARQQRLDVLLRLFADNKGTFAPALRELADRRRAAQPPAAPVEKRPPGAGPAGATFGGFEPLSPPQSCSAETGELRWQTASEKDCCDTLYQIAGALRRVGRSHFAQEAERIADALYPGEIKPAPIVSRTTT